MLSTKKKINKVTNFNNKAGKNLTPKSEVGLIFGYNQIQLKEHLFNYDYYDDLEDEYSEDELLEENDSEIDEENDEEFCDEDINNISSIEELFGDDLSPIMNLDEIYPIFVFFNKKKNEYECHFQPQDWFVRFENHRNDERSTYLRGIHKVIDKIAEYIGRNKEFLKSKSLSELKNLDTSSKFIKKIKKMIQSNPDLKSAQKHASEENFSKLKKNIYIVWEDGLFICLKDFWG
jgi:hypothetical protein